MDVFDLRARLVADYQSYTRSFIKIRDQRIEKFVDEALTKGVFWPEPLLQLNPTFLPGGTIDDLVSNKVLHSECARIFRIEKSDSHHVGKQLLLHEHQRKAILKSREGKSYVLTSGTGSGKSLAYIVPIVDHVLRNGSGRGIQAIVVYPMNALANSQDEELGKFLKKGYPEGQSPVRFARYTGQEKGDAREALRRAPPDILLTNYMMLELLLTRSEDRELVRAAKGLPYLVFDELHAYRGRQGADVALLIRRCRQAFNSPDSICIGTSATMTSGGTSDDQRREVARVAETLFGVPFTANQVIGETLERATPQISTADTATVEAIRSAVASDDPPPTEYEGFRSHKLASWIESTFGIREEAETGRLIRQAPRRLQGEPIENQKSAANELAELTGTPAHVCANVLRRFLLQGATLRGSASSRFPIFAFRLHQFLTRGDSVWATIEPEADRYLDLTKKAAKPGEPDKPLFPIVFCRHCGTPYYRVGLNKTEHGSVLLPELVYRRVIAEPFVVVFPSDHRLAAHDAIELREIVDETFLIPSKTAPTSRLVIEDYLKRSGLDIIPDHEVDNITHAVSMIASTGAVALLPAYPNNLLPWSVTSRPLRGEPPTVDLVVGYHKANTSPILRTFLSRIDDLTTRISSTARRMTEPGAAASPRGAQTGAARPAPPSTDR